MDKRARIIAFYLNNNLNFVPKRIDVLRQLAANEDIIALKNTIRKVLYDWINNGIFLLINKEPN